MGFFDYVSDLYSSLSIQESHADDRQAEARQFEGPVDTSGEQSDGKDTSRGGMGTAHHRGAGVSGGASTKTPASGTNEESDGEKEANQGTASSAASRAGDAGKGHTPGEGGAASGQRAGAHEAGPYGGPVKAAAKDDDEEEGEGEDEEEEEEEEEEEDEPVDPKGQLEEECMRSQACAPLKHHYDECAERVQKQQEEGGKAEEDCVEEFFHLMHCASACAAPKLFKALK